MSVFLISARIVRWVGDRRWREATPSIHRTFGAFVDFSSKGGRGFSMVDLRRVSRGARDVGVELWLFVPFRIGMPLLKGGGLVGVEMPL